MVGFLPEWEYVPEGWRKGDPRAAGWKHASIAPVMAQHWAAFAAAIKSTRSLGIFPLAPTVRNESGHNLSMTFGYVLARAAHMKSRLSMLDWGGALGHYALMAQHLLPEVELSITVKDLPDIVSVGKTLLPSITFETEDARCFARSYNLVVASSSLQYAEDWRATSASLVKAAEDWIFVTRMDVVRQAPTFTVVQRPYAYGYQSEYISWVFNRGEFLDHMKSLGAVLEREFIAGGGTQYLHAPEASETAGFLFRTPANRPAP
jgi:putative methyltransferase (TIGR04325 family)